MPESGEGNLRSIWVCAGWSRRYLRGTLAALDGFRCDWHCFSSEICDTPKQKKTEFYVSLLIYQPQAGAVLVTATRQRRAMTSVGRNWKKLRVSPAKDKQTQKKKRKKTSEDRKKAFHSRVLHFALLAHGTFRSQSSQFSSPLSSSQ